VEREDATGPRFGIGKIAEQCFSVGRDVFKPPLAQVAAKEVRGIGDVASRLLRKAAERDPGRLRFHYPAEPAIHEKGVVHWS
jgi:hypothetical protein